MDDNPVMIKVRAFERRHGPEKVSDGTAWYYPDGALRDADPIGVLMEPPDASNPEGEYRLAAHKLKFARLKMKVAVDAFDHQNTILAHTLPSDPDAALAELKQLGKVVEAKKALVAEAEAALSETKWEKQRAANRRAEEEQKQRLSTFQQARREIRV
jgi:hypothetical protein